MCNKTPAIRRRSIFRVDTFCGARDLCFSSLLPLPTRSFIDLLIVYSGRYFDSMIMISSMSSEGEVVALGSRARALWAVTKLRIGESWNLTGREITPPN